MHNKQRGMTFLGILVVILVVGAWVYAGIRLVPVYLEFQKIAATMNKVKAEYDSNPNTNDLLIRTAIDRHFNIEAVTVIAPKDVQVTREGGTFTLRANYEEVVPLAGNVSFLITFDRSVQVNAR